MSDCDCPECKRKRKLIESLEVEDAMKTRCHECPVKKHALKLQEENEELKRLVEGLQTRHHEKCARHGCPYRLVIPMQGESAVEYLLRLAEEARKDE